MTIHHIALYTTQLELMRSFYMRYFHALSNEEYYNPKSGLRTYFLSFEDGSKLELMTRPGLEKKTPSPLQTGYIHLAISVECNEMVDQITSLLERDGYAILSRPRITGDGYYESCIRDPDGNQIEITV